MCSMKWLRILWGNGKGNRKEYRTVLRAIWRKQSPHTFLGKVLLPVLLLGPVLSPSQFFISEEKSSEAEQSATRLMDYYIAFFSVLVTWLLWLTRYNLQMRRGWTCLWWFLPAWRIFDM